MLKTLGGAFVIISAFLFGCRIKKNMKDICTFTQDLISGLAVMKEEIRYTSDYLDKSILKAAMMSGSAKPFFKMISDEMDAGGAAEDAWNLSLTVIQSQEVRTLLSELGKQIGKSDSEGQIALLENCIEKLKIISGKQTETYERQGGMYPKFGAVSGILITILLI